MRFIKKKFHTEDLGLGLQFTSGAIAGAANSSVSTVVEHIRIRMQIQSSEAKRIYPTTLKCYSMIFKKHGIKGLYRGFFPAVLREMIGYGCYFGFYEETLKWLTDN